ncbi:MAG: aminoglycoside phosphotransferase family protein [Alphaproteobacteria bacterium]|nr:aminoglycoside phosphotransferase family protein [Alphaproteobacteria bacterium]
MTDAETLYADLARLGLIRPGERPPAAPLTGGVSSDIWKVDFPSGPICVKRALAKLKVAQDWRAPVDRSRYEIRWFRTVARFLPKAVPSIVAADEEAGVFAMTYLDPEDHPLWKRQLLDGQVVVATAEEVGARLVRIHAETARDGSIPAQFPTDAIFHDIRLSPYLEAAAVRHPDRAEALRRIVATTATTRRALVHGDVSPKNILVGPKGPIFLDAECAWFGDPAFDLGFCLNHLLLKCLVRPDAQAALLASYEAMSRHYLGGVDWEPAADVEARVATLLPGLLLARVDGKSPVEYLTKDEDKERVRRTSRHLLDRPVARLALVAERWKQELA